MTPPHKNQPISAVQFAAIDFESAGARKGETDEPVQIGIVTGTMTQGITDQFVSYIRPNKEVMWQASRVHGITTADLTDAPSMLALYPQIHQHLHQRVLIAHACGTEKRFLRAFPGQQYGPWVDSLTLAKAALPDLPKHRLGELVPYLGADFGDLPSTTGRQWHDALSDAAASFCFVQQLGQTEVDHFRNRREPRLAVPHQNIRRLDVSMNDRALVDMMDGIADRHKEVQARV